MLAACEYNALKKGKANFWDFKCEENLKNVFTFIAEILLHLQITKCYEFLSKLKIIPEWK